MWDQIFQPGVPGVFQTIFQTAPLDLGDEAFYNGRVDSIDSRLREIRAAPLGELGEQIRTSWDAHYELACRGVHWEFCAVEQLQAIAECVGGAVLAHIFDLLCHAYNEWSAGLPDLVLWNDMGQCKLVEVKGPNDRLSSIQESWLGELASSGADVELLQVKEDT